MSDDLDTLVRTVYGEAGGEPQTGQQAVAAVALNRARAAGQPVSAVVNAPGQFESWGTASSRRKMLALDPNSSTYQAIKAAIAPIVNGSAPDPTGGADHFYSPSLQSADGRNKPAWDNGTGQSIGKHLFFKVGSSGMPSATTLDPAFSGASGSPAGGATDLDAAFSGDQAPLDPAFAGRPGAAPAAGKPIDLDAVFNGGGVTSVPGAIQQGLNASVAAAGKSPAARKAAAAAFLVSHGYDPDKTTNLDDNLAYQQAHPEYQIPWEQPGQSKGGPDPVGAAPLKPSDSTLTNLGQGVRQGFEDLGATGSQIAKWVDDKVPWLATLDQDAARKGIIYGTPADQLKQFATNRSQYDQTAGQTLAGGVGRVGGNILATAPLMTVGGGVLGAGAKVLTGVAPAAEGAADVLSGTAGRAVAANPLTGAAAVPGNALLRAASLGANGAVQGGTAAAMTSGGRDEPVMTQVGQGALGGAVLGPVGAFVGNKLTALAKPATNIVRGIGEQLSNPLDVATNRLTSRVAQDANVGGPTIADMQAAAANAPGKPLTIMDLGGENVRGLAGRVARTPGEGRAIVTNALNERDQGAGERVSQDIQNAVSNGGSSYDTAQSLTHARSTAAKPLYEQAYAQPPVSSPNLDAILSTPAGKQALGKAMTIAANEGRDPKAMGFVLDQHGNVSLDPTVHMADDGSMTQSPLKQPGYSTQTLDYVKRGMDDIIEADRDKVTGVLHPTPLTSSVQTVKNNLLTEMDRVNPAYKQARAAYSGPSTSMDALNRGRQILTQRPEANRDFLANLGDGDKEFFKQGAADALLEKIARTSAGGDETKRIIGNDYVQKQLRPLFDSQGSFDKFIGNIQAEARMFATKQAVLGGSQTGARVAEDGSPATQAALGAGAKAVASGAAGHWGGVLHNGLEALGHLADRRDPATNAAVANLLTTPIRAGSESGNFLQRLAMPQAVAPSVTSGYVPRYAAPAVSNKLLSVMNDNLPWSSVAAASDKRRQDKKSPDAR